MRALHVPLLAAVLTPLLLTGCFPRLARYEDMPEPKAPVASQPNNAPQAPYLPDAAPVPYERLLSFILLTNPYLSQDLAKLEAEAIARRAAENGIPTSLLAGLIATESSFNPRAVSPVGAQGLGQLMPETAKDLGVSDPFDPEQNIMGTAKYVAWLGKCWAGNPRRWELALASYLAGVGTVSQQVKTGRPFTGEQDAYVRRVLLLSGKV